LGDEICVVCRAMGGPAQIGKDTNWQDPPWAGVLCG
jgi:hypothetical protein